MENRELIDQIYYLREKADNNKLAVFVGAGVSCNVQGMPSWAELVAKMAKEVGYVKCNNCRRKKDCESKCGHCEIIDDCGGKCPICDDFSTDEFLKIPQYLYNQDKEAYNRVLSENIGDHAIQDAPLSKAIFEINPHHIITTNYDRLLEESNSGLNIQHHVVIKDKDLLDAEKSKYIIKMHGDVLQPDTIVLKEQDYLEYSQHHVLIELFLKSLLADHTILFLGYSLNDYNVKLIISWINYIQTQSRAKSKTLSRSRRIGYIVMDEESINPEITNYFLHNNIGILNINGLTPISDIPEQLQSERGKRLYSFLSIIKNPALEEKISPSRAFDNVVSLLKKHKISDCTILLNALNIRQYNKVDSTLIFWRREDYIHLSKYLERKSKNAETLKQLLLNTGVASLNYSDSQSDENYIISKDESIEPEKDRLYSLYLQNRYFELLEACANEADILKSCFYEALVKGYGEVKDKYKQVAMTSFNTDEQVAFLHNSEILDALYKTNNFDSRRVVSFINNISSEKERNFYQAYLDSYNGDTQKRMKMNDYLSKLKEDIFDKNKIKFGSTLSELYKIKNIAMTQYTFYFTNSLFLPGFQDPKIFMKPYIEAIICANSEKIREIKKFAEISIVGEKYNIQMEDIDIISKFTSPKELSLLLSNYKIIELQCDAKTQSHVIACFCNMADSLIQNHLFGWHDSTIAIISNLAILLAKLSKNETEQRKITKALHGIFSDISITEKILSVRCADYQYCIKAFADLCSTLPPRTSINALKCIVGSSGFSTLVINCDRNLLRRLLLFFCPKMDHQNDLGIKEIIDSQERVRKKIRVLSLLYKGISTDAVKKEYQQFLSENFANLDVAEIYEFVFSGWVLPTKDDILCFANKLLEESKRQEQGTHQFPDRVAMRLDCLYILFINGVIDDLNMIRSLKEGRPHLQFILDPEHFDYSKVDFSNYMWENFARRPRFMKYFVEHKEEIIPVMRERLLRDEATETEKKVLYGFFLKGTDVWKV